MIETKLQKDVAILAAMAAEIGSYLDSDVLFWLMSVSSMPKLTLGGYLMRQFRLLALADTLDGTEQQVLNTAVSQFNRALIERVVRFEKKAHQELEARIRQWGEYLRDVEREPQSKGGYGTAVEARAMIAALTDKLQSQPYQLQARVRPRVNLLDRTLQNYWESGDFVWNDEWQSAYPQSDFWWLYGIPKRR
ncbi:MAG: hypothetical protein GY943_04055 [Chloroflexi bacterium]|nr:hypothetical protein [Chloroflexota bacterium]